MTIEIKRAYGLFLKGPAEQVKVEAAKHLPRDFEMPCGRVYRFESERDIPPADQPCGCGGWEPYEHWVVKYVPVQKEA